MICFKDRTFCSSDCVNEKCPRNFTKELREMAKNWWGGDNYPVAFSDFSNGCDEYINGEEK